tara:strand:- start:1378 stop:1824 length:447 start_codon:yes stop_codon:yes gene_type:complete
MKTFEEHMHAALRAYHKAETHAELAQEAMNNANIVQQELARASDIADKKRELAWQGYETAVADQKRAHVLHKAEQFKALKELRAEVDAAIPRPTTEELSIAYDMTLDAWTKCWDEQPDESMYNDSGRLCALQDAHTAAEIALRARLAE